MCKMLLSWPIFLSSRRVSSSASSLSTHVDAPSESMQTVEIVPEVIEEAENVIMDSGSLNEEISE